MIRRKKDSITKPLDADTWPLRIPENEQLSTTRARASISKEARKPTFPRPQRPLQSTAISMEREIPPENKIAGPERDVLKSVMRRAGNCCELCEDANTPEQLKTFYLTPLDEGGTETVKNIVVLCPDCFLKMKESDKPNEYKQLMRKARSRSASIIEYHRRPTDPTRPK